MMILLSVANRFHDHGPSFRSFVERQGYQAIYNRFCCLSSQRFEAFKEGALLLGGQVGFLNSGGDKLLKLSLIDLDCDGLKDRGNSSVVSKKVNAHCCYGGTRFLNDRTIVVVGPAMTLDEAMLIKIVQICFEVFITEVGQVLFLYALGICRFKRYQYIKLHLSVRKHISSPFPNDLYRNAFLFKGQRAA